MSRRSWQRHQIAWSMCSTPRLVSSASATECMAHGHRTAYVSACTIGMAAGPWGTFLGLWEGIWPPRTFALGQVHCSQLLLNNAFGRSACKARALPANISGRRRCLPIAADSVTQEFAETGPEERAVTPQLALELEKARGVAARPEHQESQRSSWNFSLMSSSSSAVRDASTPGTTSSLCFRVS